MARSALKKRELCVAVAVAVAFGRPAFAQDPGSANFAVVARSARQEAVNESARTRSLAPPFQPLPGAAPQPRPSAEKADTGADRPRRLDEAAGAPSWLRFGLEQRTRFEHAGGDFRSAATGDATALLLRTLATAEIKLGPFVAGVEIQDSRAFSTEGTLLNTTVVNALEILQAYVALRHTNVLVEGDMVALTLGRFTQDVGSRRLVARNDFRNTINAFTGAHLQWTSAGRHTARAFAVMPIFRLPADAEALERNAVEIDRESTDSLFFGAFFGSAELLARVQVETYALGLVERDAPDMPTANRRLITPGVRVLRRLTPGAFDLQVEAMAQVGTSRATTVETDTSDLSHRAFSTHVSVGYCFDVPWVPRVVVQHDYASGDGDPKDQVNGRFDLLFGARRFDFGPTGLYGAFARSNIHSPALRVEVTPHRKVDAFAAYRPFWLASSRDAWTTAGVRDPDGASGDFVGHQIEGRVRFHVLPRNLVLDAGAAHLFPGQFAKTAPKARDAEPTFLYAQITTTL